ncbi:MAG: hypothetical protein IPL32_12340 [Chloracidobacterium sp.]|nr:hypothetical protein [Chloracidobacterium sp.]
MVKFVRRFSKIVLPVLLTIVSVSMVFAQAGSDANPTPATPQATPSTAKNPQKPTTAEQVVETAIFLYSGGRANLDQIRKTTTERGRSTITSADGRSVQASYRRFAIRGESLVKDRIRLDQELPTAKFSLVFADEKTVGVFNNTVFTPREDAVKGFEDPIFRGLDAFLRYKANESKLELRPNEKLYGVDYYVVDITDKQERKTRFYVSAKTFRIMMLTYEDSGVRYRRKFYDYRYAQGSLVPFRTVLWADEKQIEETETGTITYGQKVDEGLFKVN